MFAKKSRGIVHSLIKENELPNNADINETEEKFDEANGSKEKSRSVASDSSTIHIPHTNEHLTSQGFKRINGKIMPAKPSE